MQNDPMRFRRLCYVNLFAEFRPRFQSCKTYSSLSVLRPAACRLLCLTMRTAACAGCAAAGAGMTFSAAFAVRTADALHTALFRLINVQPCAADDGSDHRKNNQIGHMLSSFRRFFNQAFFALAASSAAARASALRIRCTRIAAIAATAIRPGKKPAPSAPVVMSVPI